MYTCIVDIASSPIAASPIKKDLDMAPMPVSPAISVCATAWPTDHPNHWLAAANSGDTNAMVQLGLIYECANNDERALDWYRRAAEAGDPAGARHFAFFGNWLKRYAAR